MTFVKKYRFVFFLLITIIQIFIFMYWGGQKENLYWDEYYTLERAHYISDSTPGEHYIDFDVDFSVERWIPVSLVYDTLVVKPEQSVLNDSLLSTLKKMVGAYNYSILLNIAEAILAPNKLSIWPSIIINIILFVFNQLALYLLCKKLLNDELFPLAVTSLYGFSSMCISMTIFVRFYIMATLMVTIIVLLHEMYIETEDNEHIKRFLYLVTMALVIICGYYNAQFTIIFTSFFVLGFSVFLMIKRGIKRFLLYAIPVFGGGLLYIVTQTNYLRMLTNFDEVLLSSSDALSWCLGQIADFRLFMLPDRIIEMAQHIGRYLFGSYYLMLFLMALMVISCVVQKITKTEKLAASNLNGMVYVIAISLFAFFLFFTAFRLYEQIRYVSYVFQMLSIVTTFLVFRIFTEEKKTHLFMVLLVSLVLLLVNSKGKVDMLYTGDAENIEKVKALDVDNFLLYANNHTTFITYQTALLADYDAEFYVYNSYNEGAIEKLESELRDKMVIVEYTGIDDDDVREMLISKGYSIELVGSTYNFTIYKAENT